MDTIHHCGGHFWSIYPPYNLLADTKHFRIDITNKIKTVLLEVNPAIMPSPTRKTGRNHYKPCYTPNPPNATEPHKDFLSLR
jgi:hypothetical protein